MRVLVVLLCVCASLVDARAASETTLPPEDLVRALRDVRVAEYAGKLDEARALLESAAARHPTERIALTLARLELALRSGESEQVVLEYRKHALALVIAPEGPPNPAALQRLSMIAPMTEAEAPAIRGALERWAEIAPDDLEIMLLRARIEETGGRWKEAFHLRREIERRQPTAAQRLALAGAAYRAGAWEELVRVAGALRAQFPNYVELWSRHVEGLARLGRGEEAVRVFDELVAHDTGALSIAAAILVRTAWELHDAGQRKVSERIFRALARANPSDPDLATTVVSLYGSAEERAAHARAVDDLWAGVNDATALVAEAASRIVARDAAGAYDLLSRAVALEPDSQAALFNLGLAAIALERWTEARAALDRLIALTPDNPDALYNRGVVLVKLQSWREAIVDLDRALVLRPELRNAHYYLYVAHKALGDNAAAQAARARYEAK